MSYSRAQADIRMRITTHLWYSKKRQKRSFFSKMLKPSIYLYSWVCPSPGVQFVFRQNVSSKANWNLILQAAIRFDLFFVD